LLERVDLSVALEIGLPAALAAFTPQSDELAELVERFLQGPLAARFEAARTGILARELDILLPADDLQPDIPGCLSGAIDLLLRDPADGQIVVVDYKTDVVSDAAHARELAQHYAPQANAYQRAVHDALGLTDPPRFEFWFVHSGDAVPLPAGPSTGLGDA